jgi:hypothetical protein
MALIVSKGLNWKIKNGPPKALKALGWVIKAKRY